MVGVGVLSGILRKGSHCRPKKCTLDTALHSQGLSHHPHHFLTFFFLTVLVCLNFLNLEKCLGFAGSCLNVLMNFVRSVHYSLPTCFSLEVASYSEGLEMPLLSWFSTGGAVLRGQQRPVSPM